MDDYEKLLKRAKEELPDVVKGHTRFVLPVVEVHLEGNSTIFKNFSEITSALNRTTEQVLGFLLKELGTAGQVKEGGRIVFKGKIAKRKIEERIDEFIKDFVLCQECERPDTRVEREGRIMVLKCEACGAHRPLKVHKASRTENRPERVERGRRYEVQIIDIGREGDGIARIGDTRVYVPGTTKGDAPTIEITQIRANFAIGKKV